VPVSRRFSVRVIQMDYYLTRNANAVNDHQNNFPVGADCVSVVPLEIKRGGSVSGNATNQEVTVRLDRESGDFTCIKLCCQNSHGGQLAASEQAHLRAMFPDGLKVPELDAVDDPWGTSQINCGGLATGENAIVDHEFFARAVDVMDDSPLKEDRAVIAHTHAQRAEGSIAPLYKDIVVILSTVDAGLTQKIPAFAVIRMG
jgi:hypothetical protein